MQKRALTINFQRSVTANRPTEMEVAVAPLAEPNAPALDATLVGGTQTQTVLLANENNPVVFHLVPTDHPDLTERVTYRIAWREKYLGRQFSKDFVMPDFDVDYDDLNTLGNIIGGETYLQWSDRSNPGGVAALNDSGQVTDADGNVVSGAESAAIVQGKLDSEIVARQQGDQGLRTYFLQFAQDQITQVYQSTATNLNAAIAQLQNADTTEKGQRQAAVTSLNQALTALQASTNTQIGDLNALFDQYNQQFATKADLVGGKVPSSQLPDIALGKAIPVSNQAGMLALTSSEVQPGDFAVRPDGVWFLNQAPPSQLGNWVQFTIAASVFSINGQTGAVVLSAADVGARSLSQPVPLADVSGLTAALAGKTDNSTTASLTNRVLSVETDSSIVKRVAGLIPRADMPNDVVFVNTSNLITKKDGTVLNTGSGGTLDISDVTGLVAALNALLPRNDASVTNPRTPTAHKSSHATGGSDALTPSDIGAAAANHNHSQGDISGLVTLLGGYTTRIESLETRVEDLELGGGGGGGGAGASGKTVWYSDSGPTTNFTNVLIRSPFGQSQIDNHYYYDPAGVPSAEAVWPYLTPNGHLKFIRRNESAPTDAPLATQDALATLQSIVDGKASSATVSTLSGVVDTKAAQSALTALSATVDTKATITALNSTNDLVATKASQAAFDNLVNTVNTKALASDLTALTTTVNGKASSTDLTALTTRVSGVETGKADLTAGKVPLAQVPDLSIAKTTGLQAALDTKLSLVSNLVPLANIPDLTIAKTSGLQDTLNAKADLGSDGKVPTGQLPSLSFTTAVAVANRGAMLALNSTQVQPGDVAVITATADKGSYILNATDPSVFSNWIKLVAPDDAVQSVNGQSGTVVLGASDVGARSSAAQIPQADITGLVTALAGKADTTALTAGLATKTSASDVQSQLTDSVIFKQKADYVATAAVASLSGQQNVDGVLAPLGSIVLLTLQSSSVNNGLWQVNSGSWTRVSDMAAGSYFVRGSVVVVTQGANQAQTLWQETNNSGVTGTNANNWTKILAAGAQTVYTGSLGVDKVGVDFRAKVVSGGGLQVVTGGIQRDPNVLPGKYSADVPSGSTVVTITHGLNSTDVSASFRDKANGDAVLVGWKPTGLNTISAEFKTAPTSGQWRVVVIG